MLRLVPTGQNSAPERNYAVIIPARFGSPRFPGKPLAPLRGADGLSKSLIERSWDAARAAAPPENIWIATDDSRVEEEALRFGAQVIHTPSDCRNGTERCWHAVTHGGIDADIIINLQGHAPLTPPLAVDVLVDTMISAPGVDVATLMVRCSSMMVERLKADDRAEKIGATTVVVSQAMNALYFSKRVIPYAPDPMEQSPIFLHMGLYGYRRDALDAYASLDPTSLEIAEGLEQLRFLQAGIPIRMIEVCNPPGGPWEVNDPDDLASVETALAERRIY